ncbi:hypothetical protein MAHJHV50_49190 [Mycobacterium avium subsp. hominissuis]
MVVSPQRLTRWPSYVRDRHAAITYTTPRDAPFSGSGNASVRVSRDIAGVTEFTELPLEKTGVV